MDLANLAAKQAEALKVRQQILHDVGLDSAKEDVEKLARAAADARKRGTVGRKRAAAEVGPVRRSSRVAGITVEGVELPQKPSLPMYTPEAPRTRPTGEVALLDYIPKGYERSHCAAVVEGIVTPPGASVSSSASGRAGSSKASAAASSKRGGAGSLSSGSGRSINDLKDVAIKSEAYVMKVMPGQSNRIYSIGFHPSSDKLAVICGGRFGEVSLWYPDMESGSAGSAGSASLSSRPGAAGGAASSSSAAGAAAGGSAKRRRRGGDDAGASSSAAAPAADDDDEVVAIDDDETPVARGSGAGAAHEADEDGDDPLRTLAVFNIHSSVVNAFKVPHQCPNVLITTSYDGSIRVTDLEAKWSYELIDDDGLPSALDIDSATGSGWAGGFTFFVGNRDGKLYHLDTRAKDAKTTMLDAHDKKITTISLNSEGGPYLLSASGDATVKIWDARKLPGKKKAEPLQSLQHGAGVTSAYFNRSGSRIVTCSNDNQLRVFDVLAGSASAGSASKGSSGAVVADRGPASTYHNNHTGRWLTPFKCTWDPASDDTFMIGDMSRGVNVYSADALLKQGKPVFTLGGGPQELLTAVPTQVAAHPTLNAVVGGTASGRAYMWT